MTDYPVSSGTPSTGTVLFDGDTQEVYSGGVATSTIVSAGGLATILSYGRADFMVISNAGSGVVSSAGLAEGTDIRSGGAMTIMDATASGTTIFGGGSQLVSSDSVALGTVLSGGIETVSQYGFTTGTQVSLGGEELVSGGTATSATVYAGGHIDVSQGTLSNTIVSSGGTEDVLFGGNGVAATSVDTIVSNGGTEYVDYGAVADFATISSGGYQDDDGGTVAGTTVAKGGIQYVDNGPGYGAHILSGGLAIVSGQVITNSNGMSIGAAGGSTSGYVVESGGFLVALPGGTVTAASGGGTIMSTGVFFDSGGILGSTTVLSGLTVGGNGADFIYVLAGGTSIDTVVASGGSETVYTGASASGLTISGGTTQIFGVVDGMLVESGGAILNGSGSAISLLTGGTLDVADSGAATEGTIVSNGAIETVDGNAVARGTTVFSGGLEQVAGATASGTDLQATGFQVISAGGTASATTIASGALELVLSGGTAAGSMVASGGVVAETVGAAATASGAGLVVSTGVVYASGGQLVTTAFSTDVSISGAPSQVDVLSDGIAFRTSVGSGAFDAIYAGGIASGTIVSSAGIEYVHSLGIAAHSYLLSGLQSVLPGGSALDTQVADQGSQVVGGGVAVSSFVSSGGSQGIVGGSASATTLGDGGRQDVLIGTASGTIIQSGGVQSVEGLVGFAFPVTSAVDTVVSGGGLQVLESGGFFSGTTYLDGASLDLVTVAYGRGGTAEIDANDMLTVSVGTQSYSQQLSGVYTDEHFVLANDGRDGTLLTLVCYAEGTRIRTPGGDVEVQALAAGDIVVTASGAHRSIRWLGHRAVSCVAHRDPAAVRPVRIAAHAFGPRRPARDLLLSPGHPVLVGADEDGAGGHLVPIMCLVNGTTVEQAAVDEVTYWHVELDAHDILLAEGLPAESYLDWGDRTFFTEGACYALANPDFVVPGLGARCRAVAIDGPIVEAERQRLDAIFETSLVAQCVWPTASDLPLAF